MKVCIWNAHILVSMCTELYAQRASRSEVIPHFVFFNIFLCCFLFLLFALFVFDFSVFVPNNWGGVYPYSLLIINPSRGPPGQYPSRFTNHFTDDGPTTVAFCMAGPTLRDFRPVWDLTKCWQGQHFVTFGQ